ncbi:hypothetical protein [Solilutibacter pythonis]|uniref:hypothetical protein n=1 Tax=Solilutibacter pythonis TaxID=2483112 RepID=UPI0011C3BD06|nr:hypothetical protein [Lysobacter pythonis]
MKFTDMHTGLAKAVSKVAASGLEASALRSSLRRVFGDGNSFRPPNLSKYPTDDALRQAASRTNVFGNAWGAGLLREMHTRAWVGLVGVKSEMKPMRTFSVVDESGGIVAFEIENIYVSRSDVVRILRRVDGVKNVCMAGRFGGTNEMRVNFEYMEKPHVVWEPFGDSSRYWIGAADANYSVALSKLQYAFDAYHPTWWRRLMGDLFSLRFFVGRTDPAQCREASLRVQRGGPVDRHRLGG